MSDYPERLKVGKCHPFRGSFYVNHADADKSAAVYIRADVADARAGALLAEAAKEVRAIMLDPPYINVGRVLASKAQIDVTIAAILAPSPIPRGADLTDDDLRHFVEDFYVTRNWAALKMHMRTPEAVKEQCFQALRARLGRRPLLIGDGNA